MDSQPRHRAVAAILLALAIALCSPPPALAAAPTAPLVRIPYGTTDASLTPYTFRSGYALMMLVYDTLLWRDEQGIPRPWLARSVRVSGDGRSLTVELAKNARWHDGVALTARDVAFTFAHVRRCPHPRFTAQLRELERVTLTGRHRLVIRLRRPSLGFADQPLADVPILPRHLWSRVGCGVPPGMPVGSGPYRLVQRRPNGARFVANSRFFLGKPAVASVRTRVLTGRRSVTAAYDAREIDIGLLVYRIGSEGLLEARRDAIVRGDSYLGTTLMFNVRRPPFDSPRLRRGVARALDLARIARAAAGAGNSIEPALQGLLHPRSRWAPRARLHEQDVASAREALAGLDGRPLQVLAPRAEGPERTAGREVVAALRRAGARATLVEVTGTELARSVGQDRFGEDFELAIWETPPLASHDPDYLRAMFGRDGRLNYSGYRSAAFARLADRVSTARPARARREAVADELRLLARDLPVVPLFFGEGAFIYRRAAWDGWTYIAGEGVIDKRSFMGAGARRRTTPAPSAGAPIADEQRIGVLGFVAIGLLGLALAIVLVGSLRRRR